MKIFLCAALLCLVGAVSAQETTIGVLATIQPRLATSCNATTFGPYCKTCAALIICNAAVELGNKPCESPNSYCDDTTNSCTNVKPATCAVTFTCPGEGYFPNPDSCDNYFICDAALAPTQYDCPAGYAFDILNKNCKRKVYTTDCVTMKCTKAGDFVVNSKDPAYYVYCNGDLVGSVFKCPTGQQFVKAAFGCRMVCKTEGYFPGPTPQEYYHCYKSGVTLVPNLLKCPGTWTFDETKKYCVAP